MHINDENMADTSFPPSAGGGTPGLPAPGSGNGTGHSYGTGNTLTKADIVECLYEGNWS